MLHRALGKDRDRLVFCSNSYITKQSSRECYSFVRLEHCPYWDCLHSNIFSLRSMSTSGNSSNDTSSLFIYSEVSLPRPVRFWLMLLFNVPSVICAVCLVAYITINRAQRHALHNHTILLILLIGLPVQLMDINFYLSFFHFGTVLPSTPIVCRLWWLADYGFVCGGLILMAWLSVERHILIFYYFNIGA